MSYIGKIPATGNFVKLDAISVVNGQASYTMQSGSVNFTPESANHMLVSLNGVIQSPLSSFTVSGSTITFASALSTGDVINFIMVYGNILDIGVCSDDTVSAAKLTTDSVIEAKIQNDAVTRDKINAISTSSAPSFEAKGDGSSVEGKIQLNCHVNSHGVVLQSPPHSSGQSYTIKLPDNQIAADKFIKIKSITGSGSTAVGQAEFADAGGGKVNQVIQTVKTDTFSSSSGSFTDITGMSATITPSASDSKVLVMVNINVASTYRDRWVALQLLRGSTNIYLGDAASSRTRASSFYVFFDATGKDTNIYERTMIFLDSPSTTSSTTYKLQGKTQTSDSPSFVVNRSGGDTDADYGGRTASSITLMEIKA